MLGRALLLVSLCPWALAFSDSLPFVAWSSHIFNALDGLSSTLPKQTHYAHLLEGILLNGDVCDFDAIVLVEQPGLHASDLRTLSPNSKLAKLISNASSSRQFPYVRRPSPTSLSETATSISSRCGSRVVSVSLGQEGITFDHHSKHVIVINLPRPDRVPGSRKNSMDKHASDLSDQLERVASVFPKYLVVYSGSPSSLLKRQSPDILAPVPGSAFNLPGDSTVDGGILKRYQLLTPGLITTLLITFFIIVPVILIGVSALASIQSPLRLDTPKGYSAQEKKTQ